MSQYDNQNSLLSSNSISVYRVPFLNGIPKQTNNKPPKRKQTKNPKLLLYLQMQIKIFIY